MQIFNQQSRMKKIIGLRNIVTNGRKWKYLIFYDVDNPSEGDIKNIIDFMEQSQVSYIIYSTKHGIHVIGLTPLNAMKWASMHNGLLGLVPEYFSGQTIRVSLKECEKQELIYWNLNYPFMTNLYLIYAKRFGLKELVNNITTAIPQTEWHLVFEKYWSKKI
jgi:hypothetical protein